MSLRLFCAMIFLTATAHAAHLKVSSPRLNYQLYWDSLGLRLSSGTTNLSLARRSCNAHILDRFVQQYTNFRKLPHVKNSTQEQLTYQLDGKAHTVVRDSRLGRVLVLLPREVRRLKMEEALACK